jgi:hypothetical protein
MITPRLLTVLPGRFADDPHPTRGRRGPLWLELARAHLNLFDA